MEIYILMHLKPGTRNQEPGNLATENRKKDTEKE